MISLSPRRTFRLFSAVLIATLLLLGLAGCGMNEHLSGPQSTIAVEGPVAKSQYELFLITLWVSLFIFVTVGGTLAYAQIRFRARAGDSDELPPAQTHGNPLIEIGLIAASVLLLVIIAVPTVRKIWYMNTVPEGDNAVVINVYAYQWWWAFEYPELGVVTANEVVFPVGRPIVFNLRTRDVIHSFWIPRLAGKTDMIPNRANWMWLQADQPGYYWGHCAEFCGESHANMRFRAISLPEDEFTAWVERQKRPAAEFNPNLLAAGSLGEDLTGETIYLARYDGYEAPAEGTYGPNAFAFWKSKQTRPLVDEPDLVAEGRRLFLQKACVGCHGVRGHEGAGISGPDLTHFASRTTIAAGLFDNTTENLIRWLREPNAMKPGNIMYRDGYAAVNLTISEEEARALTAYLQSLR